MTFSLFPFHHIPLPGSLFVKVPRRNQKLNLELLPLRLVVGFLISGCSQPNRWAKPGAQLGEFERDKTDYQRAFGQVGKDRSRFTGPAPPMLGTGSIKLEQCLAAKGRGSSKNLPITLQKSPEFFRGQAGRDRRKGWLAHAWGVALTTTGR